MAMLTYFWSILVIKVQLVCVKHVGIKCCRLSKRFDVNDIFSSGYSHASGHKCCPMSSYIPARCILSSNLVKIWPIIWGLGSTKSNIIGFCNNLIDQGVAELYNS